MKTGPGTRPAAPWPTWMCPVLFAGAAALGTPAAAASLDAQPAPDPAADVAWIEATADRIPDLMRRFGVPGLAVLVVQGGRPVWSESFGLADPRSGTPLTDQALFRVESISKPVTAWGVLRLVEVGRVDLDDPVQRHLRSWTPPPGTPPLTVADLLSHTAGVGLGDVTARFPPDGEVPSLPESLSREFVMVSDPGQGFAYSDTGFNLLQLLVEDVTGRPFAAVMEDEVLAPLGMTHASFRWQPARADLVPVAHTLRGEEVAPYVYPGQASGGLFATVGDVGRFAVASMAPPYRSPEGVLTPGSLRRLHTRRVAVGGLYGVVSDGYGLGHFTERLSDGRAAVWHGGQGYGWMSHVHIVPSSGDGLVILATSQRAWPLFAHVLRDWSEFLGVAPVGMARLTWAAPAGWAATLLLAAVAVAILVRTVRGRARPARRSRGSRSVRAGVGLTLVAGVVWAATRDYLFLFSVLPGVVGWLGAATALLGVALVVTAGRPERGRGSAGVAVLGAAALGTVVVGTLAAGAVPAAGQEVLAGFDWTRFQASAVARARSGPFDEAAVTVLRGSAVVPVAYRRPGTLVAGRLVGSRVAIAPRPVDPSQPVWTEALYDLDLQVIARRAIGPAWTATLVLTPGLAGDFRGVDADHLTWQGAALVTRSGGRTWTWGLGASVGNAFGDTRVVPLVSLDATGRDGRVSLLVPAEGQALWHATGRVSLGVEASLDGNVYRLGRAGLLEGGLVRYSVVQVGPRADVTLARRVRLTLRAGWSMARRLEAEDAAGRQTEDAALRGGGSIGLAVAFVAPAPGRAPPGG